MNQVELSIDIDKFLRKLKPRFPKITLSRIDIESNADKRMRFYKSLNKQYCVSVVHIMTTNFGNTKIDLV